MKFGVLFFLSVMNGYASGRSRTGFSSRCQIYRQLQRESHFQIQSNDLKSIQCL